MQNQSINNVFIQIFEKIRNQAHFNKIVKIESGKYEFRSFQIENISPENALELYKRFEHKYYVSADLKILPWTWHEQEKRLFVWFMTVYSYYASKHSKSIVNYDYAEIARSFFQKDPLFIEYQYYTILRQKERVVWNEQLDQLLRKAVDEAPEQKWSEVSLKLFIFTNKTQYRSFKQCRERWFNHLDKNKIRGNWSNQEDIIILESVLEDTGKHWSKIVPLLEGRRTQHMIKNRFQTIISKHRFHKHEKDRAIARKALRKLSQSLRKDAHEEDSDIPKPKRKATTKAKAPKSKLKEEFIQEESSIKHQQNPIKKMSKDNFQNDSKIVPEKKVQQPIKMKEEKVSGEQQIEQHNSSRFVFPFENYNYEDLCGYNNYNREMIGGFSCAYNNEICGPYSYNNYPCNQFVVFPSYFPMSNVSNVNNGIPTGDSYVAQFTTMYQKQAFPQVDRQEQQPRQNNDENNN